MLDPRTSLVSSESVKSTSLQCRHMISNSAEPKGHTSQIRAGISRRVTKGLEHGRLFHWGEVGVRHRFAMSIHGAEFQRLRDKPRMGTVGKRKIKLYIIFDQLISHSNSFTLSSSTHTVDSHFNTNLCPRQYPSYSIISQSLIMRHAH